MSRCWPRSAGALLHDGADPNELVSVDDIAALRATLAPFTVERASAAAGVPEAALRELVTAVRVIWWRRCVLRDRTTMARDGVVVEWLRWVILVLTGSLDRPGGMRFNRGAVNRLRPPCGERPVPPGPRSRPDLPRVAGQVPSVALADEIEAGNVRILVVTGGNPLAAFPEPDRLRVALSALDVLVVIDVVIELTELATHVLPAAGQLERVRTCRWPSTSRSAPGCRPRARWCRRPTSAGRVGGCSPRSPNDWVGNCRAGPIPTL